jgi:hypothetical protein
MNASDNFTLRYFITEKSSILVISLVGPLVRTNVPVLEQCLAEISTRDFQLAVLLFQDCGNTVERPVFPALTRLQKVLRDRPAKIRVGGLVDDLYHLLLNHGVIRQNEATATLQEALSSLLGRKAA